jgi:hypothetical protein
MVYPQPVTLSRNVSNRTCEAAEATKPNRSSPQRYEDIEDSETWTRVEMSLARSSQGSRGSSSESNLECSFKGLFESSFYGSFESSGQSSAQGSNGSSRHRSVHRSVRSFAESSRQSSSESRVDISLRGFVQCFFRSRFEGRAGGDPYMRIVGTRLSPNRLTIRTLQPIIVTNKNAFSCIGFPASRASGVTYCAAVIPGRRLAASYCFGSKMAPRKRTEPVTSSRMAQRNGRSQTKEKRSSWRGIAVAITLTAVTAAASVPSSFTSTKVL